MEGKDEGKIIRLRETDSTNDEVLRLGRRYGVPLFVRADVQTAGRGRMGRRWISDEGGLWMSALLKKGDPMDNYKMMFGSALVVVDVVSPFLEEFGYSPEIHFPNDVFVSGKKLCGILVEEREGLIAVGVGLNVNQDRPPLPVATTLRILTGRTYDLDAMAEEVAEGILKVHSQPFLEVFRVWKEKLATLGRCVSVWVVGGGEVRGRLRDITTDMVLEIEHDGEMMYVPAEYVLSISEI